MIIWQFGIVHIESIFLLTNLFEFMLKELYNLFFLLGSHGSGDMHETFTPLVAWGSGVRGPLGEGKDFYHDGLSAG